jgi:transmembrane sensor
MSEIYENIDELLAKKLAQETTAEEDEAVDNWLKASPENVQYFKEFEWLWAQTTLSTPQKRVDTEGALHALHNRMNAVPALKVVKSPIFNLSFIMKIAAAFLLFVGIYSQFKRPEIPQIIATTTAAQTDTLTDGSVITLNKRSGLTLAKGFNKNERRMKLTGEAYFEVAHDATRPFVVDVQNVEIQAVGTAFNIDNATDERFISVMVTDGKIKITSRTDVQFAVKGETAIYDNQTGSLVIERKENKNKLSYKTRQFHFDETPLSMVVAELSKAYETVIVLKNKQLEGCPVVVTFDNKSLDEILNILGTTFSFTVEKDGEIFILSGGNCGN